MVVVDGEPGQGEPDKVTMVLNLRRDLVDCGQVKEVERLKEKP